MQAETSTGKRNMRTHCIPYVLGGMRAKEKGKKVTRGTKESHLAKYRAKEAKAKMEANLPDKESKVREAKTQQ